MVNNDSRDDNNTQLDLNKNSEDEPINSKEGDVDDGSNIDI